MEKIYKYYDIQIYGGTLMKIIVTFFIFILLSFFLSGCNNNIQTKNPENNNINASKTSILSNNDDSKNNNSNNNTSLRKIRETEISNFSTPLKSGVANRITNIKITSGKINGFLLKNGETFSFNELIGPCTAEEGYKEAEIYVNKKIEYALGGGNCQVSTTLYNAALAIERNNYN